MQRATGSPVYDFKVFYPSLNKVVIVTDIVIVTIVIIIITKMIFTEAIIWYFLHLLVEKGVYTSVRYNLILIYKNTNVLKTICHMHSWSPLNLMLIFKLHVISHWSFSISKCKKDGSGDLSVI